VCYVFLFLQLFDSAALCVRGGCDFQIKATFAQSGGATAVLIINDQEGLFMFPTLFV
jgi:signal peptide peptidase-like protein 2B